MEDYTIVANALVKKFDSNGQVPAVNNVSLKIQRGEVFGVIGPDGAGKTTLTRVIQGLLSRTSGESSILGFDSMRHPYEIRERVGYVAQQFTFPPELSVMENIRFFADIQGVPKDKQKARIGELLEFTGLGDFTTRQTKQLSGGMKKKLALSCSLIHEPSVLLLDEPTLGVDPVSRREFWSLLSTLRVEKGMTIFVCTPYMDEAERCHRVALMYRGQVIANDSPSQIKNLVAGELLEFHPEAARFDESIALLEPAEGVYEIQTYGAMLHVFVDDAGRRMSEIEAQLSAAGIHIDGMRQIEPRMEEAFISLIDRQNKLEQSHE